MSLALKGHTDSVNCLGANANGVGCIASGSEVFCCAFLKACFFLLCLTLRGLCHLKQDCTARLWDMRTLKSTRCFTAFGDNAVTSVVFSGEHLLWASAGCTAYCFDCRRPDIVLRTADHEVVLNSDEINCLAVHPKGECIAACDDSGEVKLFDPRRHHLIRTLKREHTSICSAVAFRGKSGHELLTGGMDCRFAVWDTGRGRVVHSQNASADQAIGGAARAVNPPFVHALSISASGDQCALALGNAEILLYSLRTRAETGRLRGHTAAVACVSHAPFDSERRLLSAGNDRWCVLWDIGSTDGGASGGSACASASCESASATEATTLSELAAVSTASDGANSESACAGAPSLAAPTAAAAAGMAPPVFDDLERDVFDTGRIRARFRCVAKPNAVLCTSARTSVSSVGADAVVCVADATSTIRLYSIEHVR
jgi:WD40 repeat protein